MSVLGKAVFRGSALVVASTIAAKSVGVGVQVVLGWTLTESDFAIYAIATSLTAIFLCISENGLYKILVQQGSEFERLKRSGLALAYGLSLVSGLGFVIAGLIYAWQYNAPLIGSLVAVLAVSRVVGASTVVYRAELACRLAFRRISVVTLQARSLTQILMIPFSLLGCGPLSFVLPTLISRPFEAFALYRTSEFKERIQLQDFVRPEAKELLRKLQWIVLTGFGIAMIQNGDYLVLAYLDFDKTLIGTYFFGFQLTSNFANLITSSLSAVFLPAISKIRDDQQRLASVYLRTLRMICAFSFPFCFAGALLIGPAVNLVWNGKWDSAIFVAQLLLLVLPMRLLSPIGRSFIEAKGQWHWVTALMYVDLVGVVASTYVGANIGTLQSVVIAISAWRLVIGSAQLLVIPFLLRLTIGQIAMVLVKYILIAVVSLGVACFCFDIALEHKDLKGSLLGTLVFSAAYISLSCLFCRKDYREALQFFRSVKK